MFESIIDNHITKKNVGDFLKEKIKPNADLSIVSAYFTIYAYNELKDVLNNINELNFLFGEPTFIKNMNSELLQQKEFKIEDNTFKITLKNRLKQKSIAKQCFDWINKPNIKIKSMVKPNFLHGKMYCIENKERDPIAIVGSSNFTYSGLGFSKSNNIELNIEIDSKRDTLDLKKWFNEIWNDKTGLVEDVKIDVLTYLNTLYKENSPEYIYYVTLYNLFNDYLSEKNDLSQFETYKHFYDTLIWNKLFDFQQDGVKSAINKILKYNGCILADSVGLGKTFEALAVIKYFELKNYKVLVLCPKKLRENWVIYRNNDERNILAKDRFSYDVLSHTDLSRESGKSGNIDLANIMWENYDLIVIDESHNFRNNKNSRYRKIIDDIINKGVKTKVLLLSATPVNNNLKDLRNQINIITGEDENYFKFIGIDNVYEAMRIAQIDFNLWVKNGGSVKDLITKLNPSFLKLLDELTIARSRKHIEKYYDITKTGKFPVRTEPVSVYSDIDINNEFLSFEKIDEEISEYKLYLYNPSKYVKEGFESLYNISNEKTFNNQMFTESSLIGMMKVNFLKRLESSVNSFTKTLENTIRKIDDIIFKITEFESNKYKDDLMIDSIDPETDEENTDDDEFQVGKKMKFHLKHLRVNDWKKDLYEDKIRLKNLLDHSRKIDGKRDGKLKELKRTIEYKINNPFNTDNKKIIVFTAFADTAEYLYKELNNWIYDNFKLYSAVVTGGNGCKTNFEFKNNNNFESILINFSPISKNRNIMKTMPQENEIDILIATDCISEGQNLQDCDCVINYDIHWNPVRIIQRFGRIDRLKSKNESIKMINFWPTDDLDDYINLKTRVETRMILVNIAAAGGDALLDNGEMEKSLVYRDNQLKKMKNEILDVEDFENNITLSDFTLDDFRIDLSNFIKINKELNENTPKGLYAIVEQPKNAEYKDIIPKGVIFCLKMLNKTNLKDLNPLNPYFLVYVKEDNTVKYNYINSKQILDIYRILCKDKTEASQKLCDIFEQETNNYENMDKYNKMLEKSISEIINMLKKKGADNLANNRNGVVLPFVKELKENAEFELITWLIIK